MSVHYFLNKKYNITYQIVEGFTRSEVVNNYVVRRSIAHVYNNTPNKCDKPKIEAAGDCDHLAIVLTKYSKEIRCRPHTVFKRSYKHFDPGLFLQDINKSELRKK